MRLTTAEKPYKTQIVESYQKCVKQAGYKNVKTSRSTLMTETDENGVSVQVEEPIYEKVHVPAEFQEKTRKVTVWVVETTFDGQTEKHEFKDEKDANNFYEGFSK